MYIYVCIADSNIITIMKKQSRQELYYKFDVFTKICLFSSWIIILLCLFYILISNIINIVCLIDNNNKFNDIYTSQDDENKINNIKYFNNVKICFNSSDPETFQSIIQQMDKLYKTYPCYKNIKNFHLACMEKTYNNNNSSDFYFTKYNFSTDSILNFEKNCIKHRFDSYGYKNSNPCILIIYLNEENIVYIFTISILNIKQNFSKHLNCKLFYKEDERMEYNLNISNGNCLM